MFVFLFGLLALLIPAVWAKKKKNLNCTPHHVQLAMNDARKWTHCITSLHIFYVQWTNPRLGDGVGRFVSVFRWKLSRWNEGWSGDRIRKKTPCLPSWKFVFRRASAIILWYVWLGCVLLRRQLPGYHHHHHHRLGMEWIDKTLLW